MKKRLAAALFFFLSFSKSQIETGGQFSQEGKRITARGIS
jgi:hypothetical protein